MKEIIIGTRNSDLALWQANYVSDRLKAAGHAVILDAIKTKGDKILDVSISKIGSKGVFTEELDQKLINGEIHCAVHSAKDLPSELPEELEIVAIGERESSRDVILADESRAFTELSGRIGTSSTRRIAFIKSHFPQLEVVPMRGNLPTRLAKMQDGACDYLILAAAGVNRMGFQRFVKKKLTKKSFVPPAGQGSIAVVARKGDLEIKELLFEQINHAESMARNVAERAFLHTMEGGCSVPVFAYADFDRRLLSIRGGVISLDGQHMVKYKFQGNASGAAELGEKLALKVLENGGREILQDIKNS